MSQRPKPQALFAFALLLFLGVVGGFSIGVYLQRHWGEKPREYSNAGFNRSDIEAERAPAHFGSRPEPSEQEPPADSGEQTASSLDMIRSGAMKGAMPPGQVVRSKAGAASTFTATVRKNESRYERLARYYTTKYPAIREYGRDWYNSPDLRQANLDYLKDRDPLRFAFRVAASPNFAALVKKYAARPEIRSFITDAIKTTPGELTDAAMGYLNQDSNAAALVRRFSRALGLPDDAFGGAATGAPPRLPTLKTDQDFRNFVQQGTYDPNQFNSANPRAR